ncbi:uncharacterized protein LOC130512453 [Raphanus sativus]|uniref:Uncharacterized protein LOC130512453 n=1 Tax=Raphanus sativus TaxID=3726 RepID=A0A9W3DRP5_RAPSA|nr:uncharacterized protein LOC130512453 [Raphanus sativus]
MIFKLHAVYGEWLLRDFRWDFVVDDLKGARLFLLNEDSTHAELVAMAQEDYNLDMRSVTVEISYSLPAEMMMTPGSPPIHVTSDRQVRNLLEILKTHRVCLCVSSRSKVETVSEKREEAGEWEEDVGDNDEAGEWEEDVGDNDEADECFEDVGDNESVEDENQDGEEENGEEENGEEDADNTIVGETDQNGGDYSLYGKVLDEDEEDDDNICFEEIEKTYAKTNAIEGGKSDCTSIYVNQSFVSKDALLSELRLTAVRGRFSFRIYKSTKTLLVAICRVSGCGWKIRASVKHGTNTFWVTKYVEKHLCSIGDRIAQRRHCTPKYVGSLFIDRVGIIDGITPQHITDAMKNMFGMTLDYTTSYRALLYAQKLVRGSAEEGYSRLPSYLEQISIANPDSITAIELDSEKRFKYLFLSFGASIKGFKYQRRVIVVDGTHLSGKYGGVMLVAAAQDGNFQIFPLAFGIVDAEDEPSWEWFFTKLASCISHDKPLVIVSDRHAAIKSACEKVFPWATRGICYYHLQDNIVKKFKGKHLMYLVKGAAYAHTVHDFNRYMAEIRSANPELATYLEKADAKLWSRVYCKGNRFNIKTSNIAESINSALKRARGFPIPFLLEFIRQKLGKWYWKRRQDALSLPTVHSRGVEYLLAVRSEIADTMTVEPIDGWRFFVKGGKMDCAVDLEHVKCGCGVYGVEKIPCSHAIAAGTHAGVHIDTLVCPLYSKNHLYAGYSENIYPIVSQHIEERECFPPNVKRGPGRQKKSRWQSWLELSRMRGHKPRKKHRARRCSNCKETGHTKPQCTQPVD